MEKEKPRICRFCERPVYPCLKIDPYEPPAYQFSYKGAPVHQTCLNEHVTGGYKRDEPSPSEIL